MLFKKRISSKILISVVHISKIQLKIFEMELKDAILTTKGEFKGSTESSV